MSTLKIAAVGDMAFVGRYDTDLAYDPLAQVAPFFSQHHLVIGNLESSLTSNDQPVPGKCTLRGDPKWASRVRQAGVDVLSLANNHLMDHGVEGLLETIDALDQAQIQWLGAGRNINEARRPLIVSAGGQKIALVARTSVFVASPSYADRNTPGVARFDLQETAAALEDCRTQVDQVILLLHWGVEYYRYPAPAQRTLAKQLVDAGADLIIGHHPHVLQGIESFGGGAVTYSLGNFIFDEFTWRFTDQDGDLQERQFRLSQRHRESGILSVAMAKSTLPSIGFLPTCIDGNNVVALDETTSRRKEMSRLSRPFKWPAYPLLWHIYALEREWRLRLLPLFRGKFTWQKLKKIRFSHFTQLFKTLRRSVGITRGKSTNPYE